MFTVKHCDWYGTEYLYTAERIEIVQGKGEYADGIFLDPEEQNLEDKPRSSKRIIRFAPAREAGQCGKTGGMAQQVYAQPAKLSPEQVAQIEELDKAVRRPPPMVWVMNEQGATVATYRL